MIHIDKNEIPKELYEYPVVLFGAGSTGKTIMKLLSLKGVSIAYFVDDDASKSGEKIDNIEIVLFDKFKQFCEASNRVSVIMTSIYGKAILTRISDLKQIQVYEMYDWYCEATNHKESILGIDSKEEMEKFKNQIDALKDRWADEESNIVLNGLYKYLCSKDSNYISLVCTEVEQYFIPEVISAINAPLLIIDAGSYEGELFNSIKKFDFDLEKWYCFEADSTNYEKLLLRREKNGLGQKQICINKGLWNEEKNLYFLKEGASSKIVDYKTEDMVETTTIDSYFKNKSFNFIKMDIEGAEYFALVGGCGDVDAIRRERPILAISIYHSLEDFYKIPKFLMENLENYRYYVRHHSLIFCETVLYAIPND